MDNTRNKIIVVISLVIIVVLITYGNYYTKQQEKEVIAKQEQKQQQETAKIEQNYNRGLEFLKKYKYEDARLAFSVFSKGEHNNSEKYKDGQVLYYYASAETTKDDLKLYKENAYKMAQDMYLSRIPPDYNGQFSKEIGWLKKEVKETLESYNKGHKEEQKTRNATIYIGDSDSKVTQIFGEPLKKNRTAIGNTVKEQWVYNNGKYIYIENGTVTAWQD